MKFGLIPKRKFADNTEWGQSGTYLATVVEQKIAQTAPIIGRVMNSSVAKGTWSASGTWTIPSVTMEGNITPGGTGIKIGTGTTNLISFYNAPPVSQPAVITDPTGGTTTDTESRAAIVTLIDRLQSVGLIGV